MPPTGRALTLCPFAGFWLLCWLASSHHCTTHKIILYRTSYPSYQNLPMRLLLQMHLQSRDSQPDVESRVANIEVICFSSTTIVRKHAHRKVHAIHQRVRRCAVFAAPPPRCCLMVLRCLPATCCWVRGGALKLLRYDVFTATSKPHGRGCTMHTGWLQ